MVDISKYVYETFKKALVQETTLKQGLLFSILREQFDDFSKIVNIECNAQSC